MYKAQTQWSKPFKKFRLLAWTCLYIFLVRKDTNLFAKTCLCFWTLKYDFEIRFSKQLRIFLGMVESYLSCNRSNMDMFNLQFFVLLLILFHASFSAIHATSILCYWVEGVPLSHAILKFQFQWSDQVLDCPCQAWECKLICHNWVLSRKLSTTWLPSNPTWKACAWRAIHLSAALFCWEKKQKQWCWHEGKIDTIWDEYKPLLIAQFYVRVFPD